MGLRRRVLVAALVAVAVGSLLAVRGIRGMTRLPGATFSPPAPALDAAGTALQKRLGSDVEHLAGTIGERNIDNKPDALKAAESWLVEALTAAGYHPEREPVKARGALVNNIVVEKPGTSRSSEIVVVGAHYDTAPGTPGADDNGSGVAALLEIARVWAARTPARTLRMVFFVNEEPPFFRTPFMGSAVDAQALKAANKNVVAMLSLETIGYYVDGPNSQVYPFPLSLLYPSTGNFIAFVANPESRALAHQVAIAFREVATIGSQGAVVPASIQGIDWSDHLNYWNAGYPALMVTDTAPFRNPGYHDKADVPATVDAERLARVTQGLLHVVDVLVAP